MNECLNNLFTHAYRRRLYAQIFTMGCGQDAKVNKISSKIYKDDRKMRQ